MTATRTSERVMVTGADLRVGDRVVHPRTGRTVELWLEMSAFGDDLRRFAVQGPRGGQDALVVAPSDNVARVVAR